MKSFLLVTPWAGGAARPDSKRLVPPMRAPEAPLRRSVLFVCYGSEELGKLGPTYFGEHSPVPLKDMTKAFQSLIEPVR